MKFRLDARTEPFAGVAEELAIGAGGVTTHVVVPLAHGPLTMAETLDTDLGLVIVVGLMVAVPSALACWAHGWSIDHRLNIPIHEAPILSLDELEKVAHRPESGLRGFALAASPAIEPSHRQHLPPGSAISGVTACLGNSDPALISAASTALSGLASRALAKPAEEAIKSACPIIPITAGAGVWQDAGPGRRRHSARRVRQQAGRSLMLLGCGSRFASASRRALPQPQ